MNTLANYAAKFFFLLWAGAAAAILAGCASETRMTGTWVNPDASERATVRNVLVIGVNQDSTARRIFEDAVVAQLVARGITAQPSYKLLPELGPAPPPDIEMTVRKAGFEAVLVSRTLGVSTDIRLNPGHSLGPAGFYGMWGGAFSTPPNVYTVKKVEVESRLFNVNNMAVLWSGSSTTKPAGSMQQTITEFAELLVKELAEAELID